MTREQIVNLSRYLLRGDEAGRRCMEIVIYQMYDDRAIHNGMDLVEPFRRFNYILELVDPRVDEKVAHRMGWLFTIMVNLERMEGDGKITINDVDDREYISTEAVGGEASPAPLQKNLTEISYQKQIIMENKTMYKVRSGKMVVRDLFDLAKEYGNTDKTLYIYHKESDEENGLPGWELREKIANGYNVLDSLDTESEVEERLMELLIYRFSESKYWHEWADDRLEAWVWYCDEPIYVIDYLKSEDYTEEGLDYILSCNGWEEKKDALKMVNNGKIYWSLYVTGGDTSLVENIEEALEVAENLCESDVYEVTDEEEYTDAYAKLNLDEDEEDEPAEGCASPDPATAPIKIHRIYNRNNPNASGYICFNGDY